ncbi:hypothetical protein FB446DRAFT_713451 [Lentinula raphanica]|nr:hypothetical protein FB446DRAFT_713451 [Lentinula raphanica]
MLLSSLGRDLPIAFAFLSIFGSISVTFSAAIPPSGAGSIATLSFVRKLPEDLSVQGAYRVFFDEDDDTMSKFQKLVEDKIAKDIHNLFQDKSLAGSTADRLTVEAGTPLYLFHDPNSKRYFVPYNIATPDKKKSFEGMTLRMWYIDNNVGNPQAKLYRRINDKSTKPKDVSNPKELLDIASLSHPKSILITFTTEGEKIPETKPGTRPKPVELAGAFQGLLDIFPKLSESIVHDVSSRIRQSVSTLLDLKVRVEGFPSVLATSQRFIIPYEIAYGPDMQQFREYKHGQFEVFKKSNLKSESKSEPLVQLRRTGTTPRIEKIDKKKLDHEILRDVIEMGMRAATNGSDGVDVTRELPQVMEKLVGVDWKDRKVLGDFLGRQPPYEQPETPHKNELKNLLHPFEN